MIRLLAHSQIRTIRYLLFAIRYSLFAIRYSLLKSVPFSPQFRKDSGGWTAAVAKYFSAIFPVGAAREPPLQILALFSQKAN